jgi:hypothetical protein
MRLNHRHVAERQSSAVLVKQEQKQSTPKSIGPKLCTLIVKQNMFETAIGCSQRLEVINDSNEIAM